MSKGGQHIARGTGRCSQHVFTVRPTGSPRDRGARSDKRNGQMGTKNVCGLGGGRGGTTMRVARIRRGLCFSGTWVRATVPREKRRRNFICPCGASFSSSWPGPPASWQCSGCNTSSPLPSGAPRFPRTPSDTSRHTRHSRSWDCHRLVWRMRDISRFCFLVHPQWCRRSR